MVEYTLESMFNSPRRFRSVPDALSRIVLYSVNITRQELNGQNLVPWATWRRKVSLL